MSALLIRAAKAEDLNQLTQIKHNYVREIYRGYVSKQQLNSTWVDNFHPRLEDWLNNPAACLDVVEVDGVVSGYVCYGRDPEEEEFGLIHEVVMNISCSGQDRSLTVLHSVQKLREMGLRQVRIWILQDNLRSRYLVEQLGFRSDGERRTVVRGEDEMPVKRYLLQDFQ